MMQICFRRSSIIEGRTTVNLLKVGLWSSFAKVSRLILNKCCVLKFSLCIIVSAWEVFESDLQSSCKKEKVGKMMIYHCFFLHIDLHDWNALHVNYLFIFTCKMGALLFSPLARVIIIRSGEGFSVLVRQEASVFLPPLPARVAASAWFLWAPYQQLILQFHIAVNSLLLLRECVPGSGGCSEEMCLCLCPVPSWPWEPHCWLTEQQAVRSWQRSCSLLPGDPLLLGLLSECLALTVNQDPISF